MNERPGGTPAGVRLRRPAPAIGVLVAMALLCGVPVPVGAQRAPAAPTVAAAASLNPALAEVAAQFARDRGMRVQLVFGASGTLTRQIQDGAPFEMFLAADEEFPNRLTAARLTKGPGIVYAIGRLVIFAPTGSPLSTDARLDGLARLVKTGGVTRFAIANPDVAPYGRAAEALLRARGLWDALRPRLVLGDSITQAAQFATTGNAVGGLLAYSLVLSPGFADRGTYAVISPRDHPPLRQAMVLMKRAGSTASQFYDYLQTAAARAVLQKHGFAVPQ